MGNFGTLGIRHRCAFDAGAVAIPTRRHKPAKGTPEDNKMFGGDAERLVMLVDLFRMEKP